MQIKFKIEERPGKGHCVVADQFVPKDTVTWKLNENASIIFADAQQLNAYLADKSEQQQLDVLVHAFGVPDQKVVLLLDGSGMMNHDPRPNTVHDGVALAERAVRDIQVGEEVTNDYGQFAQVEWFEEVCRTKGATSCSVFAKSYSASL